MKVCSEHETILREALCTRGLEMFIASSDEQMIEKAKFMKLHGVTRFTYDALVGATITVAMRVVQLVGVREAQKHLGVVAVASGEVAQPPVTDVCPICHLRSICPCGHQACSIDILAKAADGEKARATHLGFLGVA